MRTLLLPERATLDAVLGNALLAVSAPCGLLLTHGSPDDRLEALDELESIALDLARNTPHQNEVLRSLLTSYGQPGAVTARLLEKLSRSGPTLRVVVHGHDRDESGFFVEGGNQLCLCIFGAPRENKRFLRVDLAARYASASDLRYG